MKTLKTIARCLGLSAALAALLATGQQTARADSVSLAAPMSAGDARHLLLRTGFAPTHAEVNALTGQSPRQAVAGIVRRAQAAAPLYPPPAFVAEPPPVPFRLLASKEEQQAARREQLRQGLETKTWWMREMIATPTPLAERMTLFWHNHFATSQQKVVRSQAMWRQHELLRANALGSFRTLLHAVAKDPAMLVYLDGANSRKEAPNENFAREVMELFTLGEAGQGGRYTEQDIREAARAFTGWSVDRDDFSFRFRPAFHDGGSKTVLGRSGNLDGDAALDILLDQPAAARFIVGKLWTEFVSPAPAEADAAEIERIALRFRQSDYSISAALQDLLLSDAFWAERNRGSLIKSPVDLVVGTVRQLGVQAGDATPLVLAAAQLGQNLLVPPNVKGWPGQNDWINATTLLQRKRFTEQLLKAAERQDEAAMLAPAMGQGALAIIRFDADRWLAQYGGHADREPSAEVKTRLAQALLAVPPTQTLANGTVGLAYLRVLTLDAAYQLK